MSDTIQYKKPTCTNINFGQVPDLHKLPFRTICDPVPPLFNEKNPETYFGFACGCVESYGAGTFLINGLDSGKVLEAPFTGEQELENNQLAPGVYQVNGKIVRVERALAIPGSYQSSASVPNAAFVAKGHPAIIQKLYLNSVDPTLEINSLPVEAREIATDLARNSKEPNSIWIATPLSINVVKPAVVINKADNNVDFVHVNLQLDNSGESTHEIDAVKATTECYPAGTRGLCILQSSDVTDCADNRPIWTFIPLNLNQALLVTSIAPTGANQSADFIVASGRDNEGVNKTQNAKAVQDFPCADQLGMAFLQDCEWVAVPYSVESLNANLRAITTECSSSEVIKVKTSGADDSTAISVLRGDVVEGQPIQTIPAGTPGLLLSTPEENCGAPLVKFFPFPVIGTVVVRAVREIPSSATSGEFEIFDGLAPGSNTDRLTAFVASATGMCAGDSGILNIGDSCNFYVTPLSPAQPERVVPATVIEDSKSATNVSIKMFDYTSTEQSLLETVAKRGDTELINASTSANCVVPILPAGTKGIVRIVKTCDDTSEPVFYPTEKNTFFVGTPVSGIAFKGEPQIFKVDTDHICNVDAGISEGFARIAEPTGDMLCVDDKAIIHFDEKLQAWVADPLVESLTLTTTIVKTFRAQAKEGVNCQQATAIRFLNNGVWEDAVCPAVADCDSCVPPRAFGVYRVTFDATEQRIKILREKIIPHAEMPDLGATTWDVVKAKLKQLAAAGIYPACELVKEEDNKTTLACAKDAVFIPTPNLIAYGISEDDYKAGNKGIAKLISLSDEAAKSASESGMSSVPFIAEYDVAKDEQLLLSYMSSGSGCAWKQISPARKGLVVVATADDETGGACLDSDNNSAKTISFTPRVSLPSKKYTIKEGNRITVDISNFKLDFLSKAGICIPQHCGGTAMFDIEADEWFYMPSLEAATVTTITIPAEALECNGNTDQIKVGYLEEDPDTGKQIRKQEVMYTAQFNVAKGTPGQIRRILKKPCANEPPTKPEFVPTILKIMPVKADANIDKGEEHKFVIDRSASLGAPPPAVSSNQSIYEDPQVLTGTVIDKDDKLLSVAGDDFCVGDTGIATQNGCNWLATKTKIESRTAFHSGVITGVTDVKNVVANATDIATQIDSMTFGSKCRLFTDFDPVGVEAENVSNIVRSTNQKYILPGQKIQITPNIKEKLCSGVTPVGDKYPDHTQPVEAYSLGTAFVGDACMYWSVRINCQDYWLCMPMQTSQLLITILEQKNDIDPSNCNNGDGKLKSIDKEFLNPITGTNEVFISCSKYRSKAKVGDRFIGVLGKKRSSGGSGGASWNSSALELAWSLMELPGVSLYARVCWNIQDQDPGSDTFQKRYHKATLCDITGNVYNDDQGNPIKIGVRLEKILPTKLGTNAIYKVQEESEVQGGIAPNGVQRFFVLAEDSKRGAVPHGWREGAVAQNAPAPFGTPATPPVLSPHRHVLGKPIDKTKTFIPVDLHNDGTADDTCPDQRLCFVLNEHWSTEPANANWKWGRVSMVIGEDNPTKPVAAHEGVPYGGIIQLQDQPAIDGDTIVALNGGAMLYATWKEKVNGETVTYSERLMT